MSRYKTYHEAVGVAFMESIKSSIERNVIFPLNFISMFELRLKCKKTCPSYYDIMMQDPIPYSQKSEEGQVYPETKHVFSISHGI